MEPYEAYLHSDSIGLKGIGGVTRGEILLPRTPFVKFTQECIKRATGKLLVYFKTHYMRILHIA